MTVLAHAHGGDLDAIQRTYGIPKEEIIDFSGNINPLGFPKRAEDALKENLHLICTYPDKKYKALKQAIGTYTGADPSHIVVGNGSTELISTFIQTVHAKHSIIMGPAYSEYEREVSLGGGTTVYYPLKEESGFKLDTTHFTSKLDDSIDLLILCNPNNPTSSCISLDDMRTILDVCKEHGIYVMVDETYIEFVEDVAHTSAVSLTAYYNNIIILRGTSKFFAAPGLRLGYAITGNEDLLRNMNQRKNPWMINSLAAIAGELMFQDDEYIQATRDLISTERARCYQTMLNSKRFHPYKPTANFMLMRIMDEDLNSGILFDRAIREGLMIRDCSTFPFLNDKYIRFCFMDPADNDRLLDCLLR